MAGRFVVSAASVPELQRVAPTRESSRARTGASRPSPWPETDGARPADGARRAARRARGACRRAPRLREHRWLVARRRVGRRPAGRRRRQAEGVFVADAPAAREAVGRVAAARGSSCASMCEAVTRGDDGLVATRSIYGGVADGAISLPVAPAVCLFASGKFEGQAAAPAVAVERRQATAPSYEIERRRRRAGASRRSTLPARPSSSPWAVVSPRPRTSSSSSRLLERLGAELGCSRPIAEDFKWLPQERQVGLTGVIRHAGLYFALGISGQVQHLAGIKGARIVVVGQQRRAGARSCATPTTSSSATSTSSSPNS